jgi:hypothetical protein
VVGSTAATSIFGGHVLLKLCEDSLSRFFVSFPSVLVINKEYAMVFSVGSYLFPHFVIRDL